MEKYYEPELSEFHIEFEFFIYDDAEWDRHIFGKTKINYTELNQYPDDLMKIAHAKTRVKYLDEQDIERLGWEKGMHINVWSKDDEIIEGYSIATTNTDTYILFYSPENHILGIYLQRVYNEMSGNWEEHKMFSGIIKNQNELHKLMQQLQIL